MKVWFNRDLHIALLDGSVTGCCYPDHDEAVICLRFSEFSAKQPNNLSLFAIKEEAYRAYG
jgi:hypothetical protein